MSTSEVILQAKLSCDQISHGIMGDKIYMQPLRQDGHRMETNTPASAPWLGPKGISLAKLSCDQILHGIMGNKIHTQPLRQHRHRMGTGIAQWLEHRTRDQKVMGSNPCRSRVKIFFSRVNFLCWLLFRYPFHPRVTAVTRKRPRSFRQKCGWQVTAEHACTLSMWLCMKRHGAWLYGVHRMHQDSSSFMWHQPCQHCKYTTSVESQKRAMKSYSLM